MKEDIDIKQLVINQRIKTKSKDYIINKIQNSKDLLTKCVLAREYLSPQSTIIEKIVKKDLKILDALDEISGDGIKNNIKYEIKISLHDKKCCFNFVQIRPHHDIDYYILIGLNLFEDNFGKAYILKVPTKIIIELIIKYGGYAHGTIRKNGKITLENINKNKIKGYEYALRPNINASKNTKKQILWKELEQFQVEYKDSEF